MPICLPPTESRAGFTLIEMLVVLTVVALVTAAAATRLGRPSEGAARERAVQSLRGEFARARLSASSEGRPVAVSPQAVVGDAVLTGAPFPAPAGTILFYPDGSSSAGTILLRDAPVLEIEWVTGEVRDVR